MAALHNAKLPLTTKCYYLLKADRKLPVDKDSDSSNGSKARSGGLETGSRGSKGGRPPALTDAEERALIEYIANVENSCFAITETYIRNYASFLRKYSPEGLATAVSATCVTRFKKRHPKV